jgi:hypothetical protein
MKLRKVLFIGMSILLAVIISCKKDDTRKAKFSWVKNGKAFIYDQYKGSTIVHDYLKIVISDNQFFQNDVAASSYMDVLDRHFVVKKEGLFGLACEDCSFGCLGEFEFLYAPNAPSLNQEISQYGCGRDVDYNIKIIKVDTPVTVPLGTFNTYIMLHENGDRSYWNADEGIIMYEKVDFRDRRKLVETFKLSKTQ